MMFKGNTVMLTPRFDPEDVWRQVEKHKANSVMITGDAMGRPLIETLESLGDAIMLLEWRYDGEAASSVARLVRLRDELELAQTLLESGDRLH